MIPDIHPAIVIVVFHISMRNMRIREETSVKKVHNITEIYDAAGKCARAEEGRRLSREYDGMEVDSVNKDGSTSKTKGRKYYHKDNGKVVMPVEGSDNSNAETEAEKEGSNKEAIACSCNDETAGCKKTINTNEPYCKIHRTKGHDLQECQYLEQLAKKQKHEYEKGDKEKVQDSAFVSGKKNHGDRGGRHGKSK
ncbi:hypothetical protein ZWY2020_028810 [Hordeum vulgare]|nr:hypothetical protein ZWY2020_028810 [Hordeum vulgare]